jgi:type II secretory pathway component GspD/PulD (secretin)
MRILLSSLALCGLLVAGPGPTARAEEEAPPAPRAEIDLEDFLRAAARAAGVQFVWDPQDKAIRGKVITGAPDLTGPRSEVLPTTRSLLTFFDLVVVPTGPRGREIFLVIDARQTQSILKLKPAFVDLTDENLAAYEGQDGLFVTALIAAPGVPDPSAARTALQRIVTGQNIGSVVEVPPMHFIVTDFAPNVVTVYRTLRAFQATSASRAVEDVRTLRLAHASATDLGALLTQQFVPPPAAPQVPGRPPAPSRDTVRVQGDPHTNTLIVSGAADLVARVLEVVKALDVPRESPPRQEPPEDPTLRRLRTLKVSIDVEDQPADGVLRSLEESARVQIVVTPSARSGRFLGHRVTLHAKDVSVARVLDLVCPYLQCAWEVEEGVVYVTDGRGN